MPFELVKDQHRVAIDPATGSQLSIEITQDIEFNIAEFTVANILLRGVVVRCPKFIDRPVLPKDPSNPCVMISAGDLNAAFAENRMYDADINTELSNRMVRMIAFVNKYYPLADAAFLWSDYEKLSPKGRLYRFPSDSELLQITLQPEA